MRDADLFTAADVARFCGVDLKTIHHWAAKGKLLHHKTDGGHVRVERADLVAFLRAYGMPLPSALRSGKPRVFVVADDEPAAAPIARALARRFEVRAFASAIDALVAMGERAPQVVVAIAPLDAVDLAAAVARLRASPRTAHVRVVALADDRDAPRLIDAGTAAVIARHSPPARARDLVAQLTGLA